MEKEKVTEANVVYSKTPNALAITGFIISLVSSIMCCGMLNWLSLIFSIIGLVKSKELNGEGKGLAIAGIIISAVVLFLCILWVFIFGGMALIDGYTSQYN